MFANRITLALALLSACAAAFPVAAQQPRSAIAGNTPGAGGRSSSVSDPWQQTLQDFDVWARIQLIYTPQQVQEMRRKMLERLAGLSAEDSERFRGEINAKLHVLMSAEASDARKWLADTLAVASDSYAQKVRAKLPDVVKETPGQLKGDLDAFESRETNVKQYQQGLQQTREMQIKSIEENARRQAEANAEAHVGSNYNLAPGGNPSGGPRTYQRYSSPYGPVYPYGLGFGYRFW